MLRICALLLVAGAVTACDIETTPTGEDDDTPSGVEDDAFKQLFVEESYGIGMNWFDYAKSTHALLPKERVYRFEKGGDPILFKLESYYNERGDSGHFQIMRRVINASNEAAQLVALESNVKDAPVCVNLKDAIETDCAEGRHDLVIRTDFREIAPAGFALSTPGFYIASHYTDADAGDIELLSAKFSSIDAAAQAIDDAGAWTRYRNANSHLRDAVLYSSFRDLAVGDSSPAFLHASAQMKMIGWTMEKTDARAFKVAANCVELQLTKNAQGLPLSSEAVSSTLEFAANSVTLVSLCGDQGPTIVEVSAAPYRGMWPASDTFDLIIDTIGETPEVRFPPGHLLMSSEADQIDDTTTIPASFWENDDIG